MLEMLGWLAAIQGLAALGWLGMARILRVTLEWRLLGGIALPGLAAALLTWLRHAPAAPIEEGWGFVFVALSIGTGILAALLAVPGIWFIERRWGVNAR